MDILQDIALQLQAGDEEKIRALTAAALAQQLPAQNILDRGLIAGMNAVGEKFQVREIFLPDVLMAARAMMAGLGLLQPLLIAGGLPGRGRVVLGTVQGDLHDIGKNLVGIMLQGAGFEVIDLGNDVPAEKFVATAVEREAGAIGMSALLTTTMPVMGEVTTRLRNLKLEGRIKTIVGGAPLSQEFAADIGASAYGYDAVNAVGCVKKLLNVS